QENDNSVISVMLPRPRTGLPARYLLQDSNLYEALYVDYEHQKSWFVKDTIEKDGSFVYFTRFDPLFLLIPILDNCRKKNSEFQGLFLSLDDILDNPEYPSLMRLSSISSISLYMDWICDSKESPTKVYRLNDEKVMSWLKKKVTNILPKFDNDKYESFKKIDQRLDDEITDKQHRHELRLKYALEIVMEYLPNYWAEQLKKEYNFETLGAWDNNAIVYMSAITTDYHVKQSVEKDVGSTVKKRKLTIGQASLAKANKKGMKPLTSFFAKDSQTNK
ncbi:1880_t:CDS:2, partial [Cetraspora pellucida]